MPRLDGTGPQGMGALTGRGMGPCNGGGGFQFGCGRGSRRGVGFGRMPLRMTNKDEAEILTNDAEIMEDELKQIKERLTELGKKK
ncbi:DUF5320 domain-containing protein [Patescibacteria group bacterium]|nr:DUF5320 domain-containing protein [Patescibacteria group bacterium]MBU1074513.1 DUF5320 domain-containing protein [Patescibacteria group bacterium]MBU1951690.1 DUF5320 domain-containing protein [Patescibacteria group bacterium]